MFKAFQVSEIHNEFLGCVYQHVNTSRNVLNERFVYMVYARKA